MTTETNTKLPLSTLLEMVQSKEYQDAKEDSRIHGFNRGLEIAIRKIDFQIDIYENSIEVARRELAKEDFFKCMYEERIEKFTDTLELLKRLKDSINSYKEEEK